MIQKTKVKLNINGIKSYISSQVEIKKRLSIWNNDAYPLIQMPKGANSYNLQFVFLRNSQEVGKARCSLFLGRNKKGKLQSILDCLDVADSKFNIIGKFLYEIVWRSSQSQQNQNNNFNENIYVKQSFSTPINSKQQLSFPVSQNFNKNSLNYNPYLNNNQLAPKYYKPPNLNQPYFRNLPQQQPIQQSTQIKSDDVANKKQKKKNIGTFQALLGGCMGCAMVKNKSKKVLYFVIEPIVMEQNELPYAAPAQNIQPFSIQYFSKKL